MLLRKDLRLTAVVQLPFLQNFQLGIGKTVVMLVLPMVTPLVLLALLVSQADKGFSQPSIQSVCKRTSGLGSIVYGKNKLFFNLIIYKAIFQDQIFLLYFYKDHGIAVFANSHVKIYENNNQ